MRKTREEKAITLIALIITIVVLLILAVVAINAVTGDGIIWHATNAKTEYEKAQGEENQILSYYQQYLDAKGDLGPWKQDGNKIYMTNSEEETIELEIGDVVNYNATAGVTDNSLLTYTSKETVTGVADQTFTATTGTWKILGIENGKILLMSANDIMTDANNYYTMINKRVYLIGIEELNNICSIYGYGTGAQSARSINVDDVNKIIGYNPEVHGSGLDEINEYGNTIEYTAEEDKITYETTNNITGTVVDKAGNITNKLFYIDNGIYKDTLTPVGAKKAFKLNGYSYAASQNSSSATSREINMNMDSSSKEYEMLFKNSIDLTEARYFLSSRFMRVTEYNFTIYYGIRHVKSGGVGGFYVAASSDEAIINTGGYAIRPVIILKSNVELKDNNNDGILDIN